ncbi:ArsR family transcriptional regulator [Bacillus sp. C1-1]|nr:ArsR family transcriptional regulator [Bacillus sp. C1-1]
MIKIFRGVKVMKYVPDILYSAKLIADPSRATILQSLMEVDGLPASDLAVKAGITLQTASSHLSKLIDGGLLTVERHGRHKYYRIASIEVAEVIESLSVLAPIPKVNSLKSHQAKQRLRVASSCYDHLAGLVGVQLTEGLINGGYLLDRPNEKEFIITDKGVEFFREWNIDIEELQKLNRFFAKKCLDWSERKYHIAGSLGSAIMRHLTDEKWIKKLPERQILVTAIGEKNFKKN